MRSRSVNDEFVLMWSGGKDAMLALDVLHSQSPRRIGTLLTTVRADDDTVTMHGTPRALIERQAECLDLPLHVMSVSPKAPNTEYEEKLGDALELLRAQGYSTVVVGDLFLEDVKAYRERIFSEIGIRSLFPLWKRDTTWLSQHFLRRGYRALVTSVDTTKLDPDMVGRSYDEAFLEDLPADVDPCGEHGAFHTVVVAGPPFHEALEVEVTGKRTEGQMQYATLRWDGDGVK